jgi:hypothetical protein
MSEKYINLDEAISNIKKKFSEEKEQEEIIHCVRSCELVTKAPEVHAHFYNMFRDKDGLYATCSFCRYGSHIWIDSTGEIGTRYCSNCGARMDGDEYDN